MKEMHQQWKRRCNQSDEDERIYKNHIEFGAPWWSATGVGVGGSLSKIMNYALERSQIRFSCPILVPAIILRSEVHASTT